MMSLFQKYIFLQVFIHSYCHKTKREFIQHDLRSQNGNFKSIFNLKIIFSTHPEDLTSKLELVVLHQIRYLKETKKMLHTCHHKHTTMLNNLLNVSWMHRKLSHAALNVLYLLNTTLFKWLSQATIVLWENLVIFTWKIWSGSSVFAICVKMNFLRNYDIFVTTNIIL